MFSIKSIRTAAFLVTIIAISFTAVRADWLGDLYDSVFAPAAAVEESVSPEPLGGCAGNVVIDGIGYSTLTAAFAAINAGTHTGAISVLICNNTDEGTGTAVLNASGAGSASYTSILITPSGNRTITGATTAGTPTIDLNGADNVTIDGLNTGGNSLTISNTTTPGSSGTSTIRFIGGATNNTVTNSTILGSKGTSVATNGGNIFFSTDAVTANGNDNNTISNNNIGPAGANLSTTGILCNGSTSTTAIGNSGISITNNNIFDYFGAAVTSAGVAVNGGCNTLSITNNRFYQTATRTWTTGAEHNAILMNSSTATSGVQGMTITGNVIGFAANNQTGVYTMTGSTGIFRGIRFTGITGGTISNVNNNTIASVSVTGVTSNGTGTGSPFSAIIIANGNANTNGNTIGSQSATGSLTFSTTTTTATDVHGIFNFASDSWTSNSNTVGGLTGNNAGASGAFVVYGLRSNQGTTLNWNAASNIVGGTVANSIQNNSTSTTAQLIGMASSSTFSSICSFSQNTVRNLTAAGGTGTTASASVIGMQFAVATPNHTVSQNTIHSLTNTNTTAASVVTGIQFTGGTANVVERNLIYNLTAPTTSASAEINGIRVAGGTTIYRNNMIALGANQAIAVGAAAANSGTTGINGFSGALGTDTFVHNSVYIGGTATSGSGASYALNGTQTTNTRSFRNNIFHNARANGGGTGSNYAVKINGTAANPTGLTINNNIYFANGTGGVFGYFNGANVLSLSAWRTAVGQDAGSIELDPRFNDPTNATPDLHIHPTLPTPAEGNGFDVGVVNDFDGETRASLTPVDIGADAGNFNGIDLIAPFINYTAFGNTSSVSNRNLSSTITDVGGVGTGAIAPRIYFKKSTDATYVSTQCSGSSPSYSCTINYALVGGGSVALGDVIQYFVVAQDVVGNVSANPSAGFTATSVNSVTTPPTTPNTYSIVSPVSGSINVGAGETYTSLTNAGGVFEFINNSDVTGNITLNITSDLTGETGTNGLNQFSSPFTVTIKPSGAARSITGAAASTALIRLNGASRVTIDGSTSGGSDRSLTIENTSTTAPTVIRMQSIGTTPFTDNTVKNCVVRNGVNTSSAIVVSDPSGAAGYFNNIAITNNDVRRAFRGIFATAVVTGTNGSGTVISDNSLNTSGTDSIRLSPIFVAGANGVVISNNTMGGISDSNAEVPAGIIVSTGTNNVTVSGNTISGITSTSTSSSASAAGIIFSAGAAVTSATISNNNISTIVSAGTAANHYAIASFSPNVTISGNTVTGLTQTGASSTWGIVLAGAVNNVISRNTVSGLTNSAGSSVTSGIQIQGVSSGNLVERNTVFNVKSTNTGGWGSNGIWMASTSATAATTVRNNFVYDIAANGFAGAGTGDNGYGIIVSSGAGYNIWNNSVHLNTDQVATTGLPAAFNVTSGVTAAGAIDLRNNIFANSQTVGVERYSIYSGAANTVFSSINNNLYNTAGPNLGFIGSNRTTLADIVTGFGGNTASLAAAPDFVSATDLHLNGTSPAKDVGANIASVTDDIDGDPRPGNLGYEIGADELVDTNAPDTSIDSNPTNPSNSSSATFTFSGTDTLGGGNVIASFECRLDAGSFAACVSPRNYIGLADGSHTFQVRAKDFAGNVDPTPASYTWVIDTTAPDTTITLNPTNPTNSNSASFSFNGNDGSGTGIVGFECQIDGGGYSSCVSPKSYTGLADGSHTFQVRAIDAVGNVDATPASYTWVIDTVAPDTSIGTFPPDPSTSPDATFTFSGTDPLAPEAIAGFECQLDGGGYSSCVSPKTYTGLLAGSHTFQVRSVDTAGNVDPTPASYTWTINLGPSPVTVTATAGTTGPTDYTTVKAAFDAINAGTHQGAINIAVNANTTETAAAVLNASGSGSASYTTVLMKPSTPGVTISGSLSAGAVIILLDADNVTIDGSVSGGTATGVGGNPALRQMTIVNTSTTATAAAVVAIEQGTAGAANNTLRNLNVSGQDPTQTLLGIHVGGNAIGTSPTVNNSNILIENCSVQKAILGIFNNGVSTASPAAGMVIRRNDLSATGANRLRRGGIFFFNQDGIQVTENAIGGIDSNESADSIGIMAGIQNVTNTVTTSGGVVNANISRNRISGVVSASTTGFSAVGIAVAGGTTGPNTISNNMISGVIAPSTSPDLVAGIFVTGVTSSNTRVYNNSVALSGDRGAVTNQIGSYGIAVTGTTPTVDIRNNTFYTEQTSGGGANAKSYSIGVVSTAFGSYTLNNNNYLSTGANSGGWRRGGLAATGTDVTTLSAWQTATVQEGASLSVNPQYVSLTDLHLQAGSPLKDVGAAIATVVDDIDGDPRPGNLGYEIGADELVDTNAPDTSIDSNPTNPSNSSSATFTFSGTDTLGGGNVVAGFECKLDAGAFAACSSPQNYTGLADGSHTFQVRAKDFAGNVDPTPASYTWVIDTIAPDTSILTNPPDPSSSSSATFTFSGTDPLAPEAVAGFECQIDGGGYSSCVSPKTYTGLADGSHTFQVRAVDTAGNVDPTPASYTWTITTGPAGPVTVTATAGTTGPTDYPTFKDAIDAINAGTHQGAITVSVVTNTTETATSVLNSSGAGSASYSSILIRPVNDNVTVAGPSVAGRGLFELNGADNVTVDGDNPNTSGTNRNLTFTNTAANTVNYTSVIRVALATTIVTSADNVTIRNLNLNGSATGRNIATATSTTGPESTVFGVLATGGASTVSQTTAPSAITSTTSTIGAGATANNLTVSNNSINTVGRGVAVHGAATSVFPGLRILGNVIGNATAAAVDQVTAIGITAQGSADGLIRGNTVRVEGFIGSSATTHAIDVGVISANGAFTIENNRVERVRNNNTATWSAYGINLGGSNNHVVRNNFVFNVMNDQTAGTGAFGATFGAYGIRVGLGTGHKIYHNSVNIFGPLAGTTSTNLTAAFMIVATTQTGVDVRNNIFVNTATGGNPTGTRHVAIYLPSGATSAMNLIQNNNDYVEGTDANSRLGQVGATFGTGEYTAANFDPSNTTPATNFRAYSSTLGQVSNDNASQKVDPQFVSATDLHIAVGSPMVNAGAAVGVPNDIDDQLRVAAPDVGADEPSGVTPTANDMAAVAVVTPANAAVFAVGASTTPQALFANVGANTQTGVSVRFQISGPGGYVYTDTQSIPSIGTFQSTTVTFAAAPAFTTPGAYTTTAEVLTPDDNGSNNSTGAGFTVVPPLSGTYTVGSGGSFTSLTNPGGLFEQLNTLGAAGNVTANITSDLSGETGVVVLNQLPGGFGLTIKPSGGARTITGTGPVSSGLINLNGADNVTIDGSLSGGSDRNLTIVNLQTGTSTIVWIRSASASNGASNNTIKNTILRGAVSGTAQTTAAVLAGSGVTIGNAAEAPNNNNSLVNNWMYNVQNAFYNQGNVGFDQNWVISNNDMGSANPAEKNFFRGLLIGNVQNFIINGNRIRGISSTTATTAAMSGIQLAFTLNGGFVVNNTITDIKNNSASGTGAFGMQLSATSAASNVTIANNFISDIAALGSATVVNNGHGINVNGAAIGGLRIHNNSINMNTNQASGITSALNVTSAVTAAGALDVRNNSLVNSQTTGATRYAVYSAAAATVFNPINYNNYLAQNVGFVGGSTRTTLGDWQTATGQDANSVSVAPDYVSATDLHLKPTSGLINIGQTIAAISTDIDGQARPIGAAYDIGADEFTATVTIYGRILTDSGNGIRNVAVGIEGPGLATPIVVPSSSLGYYTFTGIPTGFTYIISVGSKRYTFTPDSKTITPYADIADFDFIADPVPFAPRPVQGDVDDNQ